MSSSSNPPVVIGRCMTMCPESEVRFRRSHNMVHPLERSDDAEGPECRGNRDRHRMVKEYTRSAVGSVNHIRPDLLRPTAVLLKTVRYLLDLYQTKMEQDSGLYDQVFAFVCDRLRAVRQDMILQQCCALDSMRILEAMIPFYFETDYLGRTGTRKCRTYDSELPSNSTDGMPLEMDRGGHCRSPGFRRSPTHIGLYSTQHSRVLRPYWTSISGRNTSTRRHSTSSTISSWHFVRRTTFDSSDVSTNSEPLPGRPSSSSSLLSKPFSSFDVVLFKQYRSPIDHRIIGCLQLRSIDGFVIRASLISFDVSRLFLVQITS
ncbi:hypothetical protein KIN20_038331 [Parelaphostrongylus tenuis]|uniref:SAC3/GANP/THP3 conserved domain-containing protein n=1 Tax=Parelaphostrongylus tenuis TaxID=148309 RepID=A0AAD5REQ2_PARTN|nr:hypothetical protein KIN20_038331 [Parelaphostrongylus tenuis]